MVDTKTTGLAALAALADADIWACVDDPGGTPLNRKITALKTATYVGTKNLSNLANAETGRTNLGVVIGTDVQAFNTNLTTLASAFTTATSTTAASLAFAEDTDNGSNTITLIAPAAVADDKTVTFQDVTGTVIVTGGTDLPVADGGTGASNAATARTNLGVPGSTTDNTIIRANGTAGQTQGSKIVVSDVDEISEFHGLIGVESSTAITLVAADTGTIITTTSTKAATIVTLPNSLLKGFNCSVIQNSTASVTFAAATGATLNNRQSHTKIAGQNGVSTVIVVSTSGGSTAAVFVLAGDTST